MKNLKFCKSSNLKQNKKNQVQNDPVQAALS